jgi:hypothetical protein
MAISLDATGGGLDTGRPLEFDLGQAGGNVRLDIVWKLGFTGEFFSQVLEHAIRGFGCVLVVVEEPWGRGTHGRHGEKDGDWRDLPEPYPRRPFQAVALHGWDPAAPASCG